MEPNGCAHQASELTWRVHVRTGWRIRNLAIELHPERAVLRGQATTNFTRLLAEHVAQDFLPHLRLENAIDVDCDQDVLLGVPMS